MKNSKQLISASIIATLILSNAIIGDQYIKDTRYYESRIHNQSELIKQYKVSKEKNEETILKNNLKLTKKDSQINGLNTQLDQIKEDNDELKKELESKKEVDSKRKLNIEASAYISSCRGCSGKTFTGYNVNNTIEYNGYHIIAADTNVIPLYSIVKIDTQNESFNAIVLDTGGAIKEYKIDLLVGSYEEAMRFGRQNVTVTVIREGN